MKILLPILILTGSCFIFVLPYDEDDITVIDAIPTIIPDVVNEGDLDILDDVHGNYEIVEEDDVVILTQTNFNHVIHTREYVLVEFYAPWCMHCKSLAPLYASAAKELKKSNLTLAKVNVDVEKKLGKEHMITSYPTVMLFHKGQRQEEFEGERTTEGLINYMQKRASPDWKPPPTQIVELTSENFESFMAPKPLVLVLFYANYCKHCQQIKPEYISAARELKEWGVPLTQIEGTIHKEIADEYKVKGWPTLYIFRYGRAFEYKGPRDHKGIVNYMKEQRKSPSKECNSVQEVENRVERYIPTIIGVFESMSSDFYREFLATANFLRQEPLRFVHTFSKKIGKLYGVKDNMKEAVIVKKAVIFGSNYEPKEAVLSDKAVTGDDIADFIRANYRPLVGQRTKENQQYFYSVRPLVVVYYDANFDHQYQKNSEITRSKILEVAKDFPELTFAVANEDDYVQELEAVKLDDSGVDVNIVWYDENRIKYRMEPVDDFDGSDLRTFVTNVADGELKPVWKSLPKPQKQEGPVHVLVADSFEEEVLKYKQDRDVVFYVYAPWCGHCKQFDATYKKLAKQMGSKNLLFAKMDGVANDVPPGFEIKGYPTIFFIPAFKKHEPALYTGDRSAKDFKSFVNLHSSIFLTEDEKEGRNKVEL